MNLKDEIRSKLYTVTGKLSPVKVNKHVAIKDKIYESTKFLDPSASISERVYCIMNDIAIVQRCPITGKPVRWCPQTKKYRIAVGSKNSLQLIDREKSIEKFKATITARNNNIRATIINNYTTNNYRLWSEDEILKWVDNRNDTHVQQIFGINELIPNNDIVCSIIHYTDKGVIHGDYTVGWSERIYLIRHGLYQPPVCIDDPDTKAPYENSNIGYRRTENYFCKDALFNGVIIPKIKDQGFEILGEYENKLKQQKFTLKCVKCGHSSVRELTNGRWKDIYCEGCFGSIGRSKTENDVLVFIQSVYTREIVANYKLPDGREIDIFLPDLKLGIEFNGVLWHSFGNTHPNNIESYSKKKYHILEKQQYCNNMGIRIINIFSNEWDKKQNIIKSMLSSKINNSVRRIYARKCVIGDVDPSESNTFLDSNHLQGRDNSTTCCGLYFEGKLVSLMTFNKRKITGADSKLELVRFCNILNTQVVGGASRLLKYFINKHKPSHIVTYADKRYSDGNLYKQLGFTHIHDSAPNYFYTKNCIHLESRIKYQKHKLPRILDRFNADKTEFENMIDNEFRVIYDCGNKVYEMNIHQS